MKQQNSVLGNGFSAGEIGAQARTALFQDETGPQPVRVWRKEALQFFSLCISGGAAGALTLSQCSHILANAQTGNLLALAEDLVAGSWVNLMARLGAVALYLFGIWLTVRVPQRRFGGDTARWAKVCLVVETICFALQALLPTELLQWLPATLFLWPVFFASALQYNTFNRMDGAAISTVFSTNNLRQFMLHAILWRDSAQPAERRLMLDYLLAVCCFLGGAVAGLLLAGVFGLRAFFLCAAITAANAIFAFSHK